MQGNAFIVIVYALFWPIRINGCIRRNRQPLLRGEDWFFDVPVQPDFYSGAGKKLLLQYRLRMLIPFAVDIPFAAYIVLSGHLQYLAWLMVGLGALIHLNHVYSVDFAERQARAYAPPEVEQPTSIMASSLAPRRLRDYSSRRTEWVLALATIVGFTWLLRYYFTAPVRPDIRSAFGAPILFLYLQVGMLLIKQYIIAWRSPVPETSASEHIEAREQTRIYYLRVCDWNRASAAACILFWPFMLTSPPAEAHRLMNGWLTVWLLAAIAATVWVEFKRKRLVALSLRARPVKMPDLLNQSELASWPLCYQPSVPLMVLRGARGYSLNLANVLTRLSAAYLAGMAALIGLLHRMH